nr:MAG TPA: hypothetical protein [Caudoviricetes sp.]
MLRSKLLLSAYKMAKSLDMTAFESFLQSRDIIITC